MVGTVDNVLISEVSLIQSVLYREVSLYKHNVHYYYNVFTYYSMHFIVTKCEWYYLYIIAIYVTCIGCLYCNEQHSVLALQQ